MNERTMTVVIPTFRPGGSFRTLLERLARQTERPQRVLIVNTGREDFPQDAEKAYPGAEVIHIRREEFDHGGTRDMAARMCETDLVVFMTQDAVPADSHLLEKLSAAFGDPGVGAAYARQLPAKDAGPIERYTRRFNYGPESMVKSASDLDRLGVQTYFCSDVCAAYRLSTWRALGGFEHPAIFNEDMIYAAGLIGAGGKVAYCADARVIHSHNYGPVRQLHRNFDLGVSQAQHPEIFQKAGASEGTGIRLVRETAGWLIKNGYAARLPELFVTSAFKYAGYRLGKAYRHLPYPLILKLTDNRPYWDKVKKENQ